MVYIFTEDSTSGFDFISQIVRIVNLQLNFIIDTANGCKNIATLLNKYSNSITRDDIIVLYFDLSTLDLKEIDNLYKSKKGLSIICKIFIVLRKYFLVINDLFIDK